MNIKVRFGCTFFLIIFLTMAAAVKFFVLNKFITGVPNIILTCLLFLGAIILPFLISLYRAGIGVSSVISAIVLGRLDLIGINLSGNSSENLRRRAQSIQRIDAQISEISIRIKGSGRNSRTIVGLVFNCKDDVVRKFSIDPHDSRVSGKHYKRLDDETCAFIWQGVLLVQGDTGVLSYNPDQEEIGFRGFYKDMTVADFEKISQARTS